MSQKSDVAPKSILLRDKELRLHALSQASYLFKKTFWVMTFLDRHQYNHYLLHTMLANKINGIETNLVENSQKIEEMAINLCHYTIQKTLRHYN